VPAIIQGAFTVLVGNPDEGLVRIGSRGEERKKRCAITNSSARAEEGNAVEANVAMVGDCNGELVGRLYLASV
jgi:hypothetical protein